MKQTEKQVVMELNQNSILNKKKILIIDDEPIARSIIKNYIEKLSSLNFIGECINAMEALSFLHQHKVDILFLDIKMPYMTGLELLKTLSYKPNVILTTAYSEFALESYEYNGTYEDYYFCI